MVSRKQILNLVDRIIGEFPEIEKVVLFGSHAYGKPHRDSDVDLLVIMEHSDKAYRAASRIRSVADVDYPLDILVRSPERLAQRIAQHDDFILQIMAEGIVLYEAGDRGVDTFTNRFRIGSQSVIPAKAGISPLKFGAR